MGWYYAASVDTDWWHGADSREDAIREGLAYAEPGETYAICEADPQGPFLELFSTGDLAEHIESSNEERAFEDGFLDESGLSEEMLEPLAAKINALWVEFVAEHKLTSRALDIKATEEITRPLEVDEAPGEGTAQ